MSTKTSIKRIALVAAAALTLGGFSAITATSANAYTPNVNYTNMYDTTNGYQVVGGQATVQVVVDTGTLSTVSVSNGTVVSATAYHPFETLTAVSGTGFQVNPYTNSSGNPASLALSSGIKGGYSETVTVVLTSAVAGTTTITVQPLASNGSPGTPVTKTVTWTASGTLAATTISTALVENTSNTMNLTGATDSTVPLYETASNTIGNMVAGLRVQVKDQNGNGVNAATVVATVSGPGLINATAGQSTAAFSSSTQQRALTATTDSAGYVTLGISADGSAGVSTITVTSGTVSASKSLTFVGAAKSYTPVAGKGYFAIGTTNAASTDYGVAVKVLDSAGNLAKTGTVYAASSNTAVATVQASASVTSGYAYFAVTGVTAGKATITFTDASTAAATTITATQAIEVTSGTADKVTVAFDKSSYAPGEKVSLQFTLTNAAGRPVADGTYTILSSTGGLSANLQTQPDSSGGLTTYGVGFKGGETQVTTTAGVAELNFFAPVTPGSLTITGTTLSATTASSALSANVRALALSATASIVAPGASGGDASLALDAANAATDAANNAYDEAQNATQAAQDALAAVTALAKQVSSLIASVKSLTALVSKIKAKVGA